MEEGKTTVDWAKAQSNPMKLTFCLDMETDSENAMALVNDENETDSDARALEIYLGVLTLSCHKNRDTFSALLLKI